MGQSHGEEGHGEHEQHTGPLVVMFIFVGLLLGGALRQLNRRTKIPYTPMLLILGIVMAYFHYWLGEIGQSTSILAGINPHMILLIFIPVLIFESAFNCEWHVFRKSLINILILAAPGVLMGAIMIGMSFKLILFYTDDQISWYQAFTLGCVLSATDPVAVVALLKQLGASVRFNTLVQGQSLLNDGTAMVFFFLFLDLSKGGTPTPIQVVGSFIRLAIGGALLGIVFGFFMSKWIKSLVRDSVLTANITIVGAFLIFYVAQFTIVKVSGILALVSLGLYMSAVGKRKINHQVQHSLHNIWSYVQYACETLIFILTGIVVASEMLIKDSTIQFSDWVKMFIFWFLMIGVRFIMVLTFLPILSKSGYGITKKQVVVLIYGGLRGALGLCLSLLVGFDMQLPTRFREITVFYMCGMAMMTIIVNGFTCGKIVNYIQMITIPQIKVKLFQSCIKEILISTEQKLRQLRKQPDVCYAKWDQVQKLAETKYLAGMQADRSSVLRARDSYAQIMHNQVPHQMRFRFTRTLQSICWQFYQTGQVSEYGVQILSEMCDISNDQITQKLAYWQLLSSNFTMGTTKYYLYFQDFPLIGPSIRKALIDKVYYIYEISITFLDACQQALHKFEHASISQKLVQTVQDQIRDNIDLASQYVTELQQNYPQIIQCVQTTRAATILVKNKQIKLKQIYDQGIIDHQELTQIQDAIDSRMVAIQQNNYQFSSIKTTQVFTDCPLFSALQPKDVMTLKSKSNQKVYQKGSILIDSRSSIQFANIVVFGHVKQEFNDFSFARGIGTVINPYDLTYKTPSSCTAKAECLTRVIQIPQALLNQYLDRFPQFRKQWYKSLFSYWVKVSDNCDLQDRMSPKQLRRFVQSTEVVFLAIGQKKLIEFGALMLMGRVKVGSNAYKQGDIIGQGSMIEVVDKTGLIYFKTKLPPLQNDQNHRLSAINAH